MARQEELFALALDVKKPIYIEMVEFDKGKLYIRKFISLTSISKVKCCNTYFD